MMVRKSSSKPQTSIVTESLGLKLCDSWFCVDSLHSMVKTSLRNSILACLCKISITRGNPRWKANQPFLFALAHLHGYHVLISQRKKHPIEFQINSTRKFARSFQSTSQKKTCAKCLMMKDLLLFGRPCSLFLSLLFQSFLSSNKGSSRNAAFRWNHRGFLQKIHGFCFGKVLKNDPCSMRYTPEV